jgi:hypothetical protein
MDRQDRQDRQVRQAGRKLGGQTDRRKDRRIFRQSDEKTYVKKFYDIFF